MVFIVNKEPVNYDEIICNDDIPLVLLLIDFFHKKLDLKRLFILFSAFLCPHHIFHQG